MAQQFGILNGNSRTSQYLRDCQFPPTQHNTFDLAAYAERIAIRYEAALTLLRPDYPSLFIRGLGLVRECERQIVRLVEFAEAEAEVAS